MSIFTELADDALPRFAAAPGAVRGNDQARNIGSKQDVAVLRRLLGQYIGRRAAQVAGAQCVSQSLLINQAAAGGVDQKGCGLHQVEFASADHIQGVVVQRAMQGQCVDLRQQFIQWQAVGARRAAR